MGRTQEARRSDRLRDIGRDQYPQIVSGEETTRTRRAWPCRRDTISTQDRHRNRGNRLAMLLCLGLLGSIVTPSQADAKTVRDCPQYHQAMKKYGLPPKVFGPISYRESRCNPKSVSAIRISTGRPDVGLLQVSGSWATVTRNICRVSYAQVVKALTRLECNLKVSAYLWQDGKGASNWSVRSARHGS